MKRVLFFGVVVLAAILGAGNSGYAESVTTQDTGIGGDKPAIAGNIVAFSASESVQNIDLNGDGMIGSRGVLGYIDLQDNTSYNTGLTMDCAPSVDNGMIVFISYESLLNRDIDGDGYITSSGQLLLYDTVGRELIVTGVITDNCPSPDISNGKVAFTARESSNQNDLNGDGEFSTVVGVYDIVRRKIIYDPDSSYTDSPSIYGNTVVHYDNRSGIDVTGDGYQDYLAAVYNTKTKKFSHIPVKLGAYPNINEDVITFLGWKGNGYPATLHYYDVNMENVVDTGLEAGNTNGSMIWSRCTSKSGDMVLLGGTDGTLNIYNMATGQTTYTGVATRRGCSWPRALELSGTTGVYETPNNTIGILHITQ